MEFKYKGYRIVCTGPNSYSVTAANGTKLADGLKSKAKAKEYINAWEANK